MTCSAGSRSRRASSGSRPSINSVEPRSAKYRHLFALTLEGGARCQNFLDQIGRRVGQWARTGSGGGGETGTAAGAVSPVQTNIVPPGPKLVHRDDFLLEDLQQVIVQVELDLERTIRGLVRDAAAAPVPAPGPRQRSRPPLSSADGSPGLTRRSSYQNTGCGSMWRRNRRVLSSNSSSSALASWRSAVSKPSVNQP